MDEQPKNDLPLWLAWAREIQALAQTGLHFSENEHYHQLRYRRLMEIAAEMVGKRAGLQEETVLATFLEQAGYATPKVDVRGAVSKDGLILLVRECTDLRWCLPGGWADVGESPSEMVIREVWEESGLRVRPSRLVGVYDANRAGAPLEFFHAYKLVFLCDLLEGEPTPSEETVEVGFFGPNEIPPLSEQRTALRHLDDVWKSLADPNRAARFE